MKINKHQELPIKEVPTILQELFNFNYDKYQLDPFILGYQFLFDKLKKSRKGVVHVGGHIGQELPMYAYLGFCNIVFIEPLKEEYEILSERVMVYNNSISAIETLLSDNVCRKAYSINKAVSDFNGSHKFYKTEDSALSSLTKPITDGFKDSPLSIIYDEIIVECKTLDTIINELPDNLNSDSFDYLRINVQGSELKVLKGALKFLNSIDIIDLEINIENRYEGNPNKEEFDKFLLKYNFYPILYYKVGNFGNIVYHKIEPI